MPKCHYYCATLGDSLYLLHESAANLKHGYYSHDHGHFVYSFTSFKCCGLPRVFLQAFPLGSPLVPYISRTILNVTQDRYKFGAIERTYLSSRGSTSCEDLSASSISSNSRSQSAQLWRPLHHYRSGFLDLTLRLFVQVFSLKLANFGQQQSWELLLVQVDWNGKAFWP